MTSVKTPTIKRLLEGKCIKWTMTHTDEGEHTLTVKVDSDFDLSRNRNLIWKIYDLGWQFQHIDRAMSGKYLYFTHFSPDAPKTAKADPIADSIADKMAAWEAKQADEVDEYITLKDLDPTLGCGKVGQHIKVTITDEPVIKGQPTLTWFSPVETTDLILDIKLTPPQLRVSNEVGRRIATEFESMLRRLEGQKAEPDKAHNPFQKGDMLIYDNSSENYFEHAGVVTFHGYHQDDKTHFIDTDGWSRRTESFRLATADELTVWGLAQNPPSKILDDDRSFRLALKRGVAIAEVFNARYGRMGKQVRLRLDDANGAETTFCGYTPERLMTMAGWSLVGSTPKPPVLDFIWNTRVLYNPASEIKEIRRFNLTDFIEHLMTVKYPNPRKNIVMCVDIESWQQRVDALRLDLATIHGLWLSHTLDSARRTKNNYITLKIRLTKALYRHNVAELLGYEVEVTL